MGAKGKAGKAEQATLLDVPPDMDPCGPQGSDALYTAERARKHRPEACRIAVEMLGAGMSLRRVMKLTRLHPYTIRALQEGPERETLETLKGRTKVALSYFVAVGAEKMMEEVESMDLDKLPIAVAVAIDKLQLLSGGATERIEHVHAGRAPQTLDQMLAANGLGAEARGQTRGEFAADEPAVVLVLPDAVMDVQSSGSQREERIEATGEATDAEDTGGGDRLGGARAGGGLD